MSNFLMLSFTLLLAGCVTTFPQTYQGTFPDCKAGVHEKIQPVWPYARMTFVSAGKKISMDLHSEIDRQEIIVVGFTELGNRGLLFKEKSGIVTCEIHPMYQKIIDPAFIASAFSVASKVADGGTCGSMVYKINHPEVDSDASQIEIYQPTDSVRLVLEPFR